MRALSSSLLLLLLRSYSYDCYYYFFGLSMRVVDANIQEESGGGCIHEFLDIHACDRFIRLFFAAVGAPFAYPWIHLAALHRSLFIFY